MNIKIIPTPEFSRSVKKLYRKYKQIHKDLEILENELLNNQKVGINLGNNCYKLRLPNSSISSGKRGGFRVICYYRNRNYNVYLLSIYSKAELENISNARLIGILKKNGLY